MKKHTFLAALALLVISSAGFGAAAPIPLSYSTFDDPGSSLPLGDYVYTGGFQGNNLGYFSGTNGVFYSFSTTDGAAFSFYTNPSVSYSGLVPVSGTNGTIVGNYTDAKGGHHGYQIKSAFTKPVFSSLDVNTSGTTFVSGASSNAIVGTYLPSNGYLQSFLYKNGAFTLVSYPAGTANVTNVVTNTPSPATTNSSTNTVTTNVVTVNIKNADAQGVYGNTVWGDYVNGSSNTVGFLYNGTNYRSLAAPVGTSFVPTLSSNTIIGNVVGSDVVGTYADAYGFLHGFWYDGQNYNKIDYRPNGVALTNAMTDLVGMLWNGTVIGNYYNVTLVTNTIVDTIAVNGIATTETNYTTNTITNSIAFADFSPTGTRGQVTMNFADAITGSTNNLTTFIYLVTPTNYYGTYNWNQYFVGSADSYNLLGSPPDSTEVTKAINGSLIGDYRGTDGLLHGYLYNGVTYTNFSVIFPGQFNTVPKDVATIGASLDIVGNYISPDRSQGAFFYNERNTSQLIPPGSSFNWVDAVGFNSNAIVGNYYNSNGYSVGFSTPNQGASYSVISAPFAAFGTSVKGVDVSTGTVYGNYLDANYQSHGYLLVGSNSYTDVTSPQGTYGTYLAGYSQGVGVGNYYTADGLSHGFLVNTNGAFVTLDNPSGVGTTVITGIANGFVVGNYLDQTNGLRSFIYNGSSFTPVNAPNSTNSTTITGITGSTIYGFYRDIYTLKHGFTAAVAPTASLKKR